MLLALATIAILQMEKSAYIAERQSAMAIPFMTFAVIKIFKTKLFPCLHTENTELYEECCACFFPMQKDSASFGNPLDLEQVDQLLQDIETASPPNPSAKSPASFLFAT